MEVIEINDEGKSLKIVVDSNEESLFSLLKVYLEKDKNVDLAGVVKEHYLIDRTEFYLKVNSGSALDIFKTTLIVCYIDTTKIKLHDIKTIFQRGLIF